MIKKDVYIVQPYKVGTKTNTSLAMIIPSRIVKSHNLNPSTIFRITANESDGKIVLERIEIPSEKVAPSAGENSKVSSQQITTSQTL